MHLNIYWYCYDDCYCYDVNIKGPWNLRAGPARREARMAPWPPGDEASLNSGQIWEKSSPSMPLHNHNMRMKRRPHTSRSRTGRNRLADPHGLMGCGGPTSCREIYLDNLHLQEWTSRRCSVMVNYLTWIKNNISLEPFANLQLVAIIFLAKLVVSPNHFSF